MFSDGGFIGFVGLFVVGKEWFTSSVLSTGVSGVEAHQGCQIFLGPKYQNVGKYTKLPQNIPNGHNIFPMAVK
jgi:hypothetical protein